MDASLKSEAERLAGEIASQSKTVGDLNSLMRLMMKSAMERMLDTEMDVHLGRVAGAEGREDGELADESGVQSTVVKRPGRSKPKPPKKRSPNRRNGRSSKKVQSELGEIPLETPRDRNGTFEPQLIGKHQRRLEGFDEKILALYAKGMTTRDIQDIVRDLLWCGHFTDISLRNHQRSGCRSIGLANRSLDAVWPIVYFDGIVVHVRGANSRVSKHTIYVALGVNLQEKKNCWAFGSAKTKEPSSGCPA